jgi:hypothetical protein
VVPVREAAVRETVFAVATFLSVYEAARLVNATFAELFASPAGTFCN